MCRPTQCFFFFKLQSKSWIYQRYQNSHKPWNDHKGFKQTLRFARQILKEKTKANAAVVTQSVAYTSTQCNKEPIPTFYLCSLSVLPPQVKYFRSCVGFPCCAYMFSYLSNCLIFSITNKHSSSNGIFAKKLGKYQNYLLVYNSLWARYTFKSNISKACFKVKGNRYKQNTVTVWKDVVFVWPRRYLRETLQ